MRPLPQIDPALGDARSADLIEHIILPRARDLGGFTVGRVLPSAGAGETPIVAIAPAVGNAIFAAKRVCANRSSVKLPFAKSPQGLVDEAACSSTGSRAARAR